jgi:cytochrome c biogenesis protein CcmG/thiol:disulfide interchange protein DsbE
MSRRPRVLLLVAAVALVAVVVIGLRQAPETKSGSTSDSHPLDPAVVTRKLRGAPPPLAALHRRANDLLPGSVNALDEQLAAVKGHPAVVNVWAAWCGPCIVELPLLQDLSLDYGKRVAFLGVDIRDNRARAQRLLRRIPLTYPSVEDPKGKAEGRYRLIGTPTTIYFDRRGRETFTHVGPYTERGAFEVDIRRYALGRT